MAIDSDELVVAGTGRVYVAPIGTALPTTEATALNAAFVDLGYTTEDGVSFAISQETTDIMAWQSRSPIRRILTAVEFTNSVELQQWNPDTFQTAFGGGVTSEVSAGHYRYDFIDDDDALAEHILILEFNDGDKIYRLVEPRVTLNDGTEVTLTRTAAGTMPVSLKALKPDGEIKTAFMLTNDPAFEVGS